MLWTTEIYDSFLIKDGKGLKWIRLDEDCVKRRRLTTSIVEW